MIRCIMLVILLLTGETVVAAPSVIGLWLTQGRDGVVKISRCGVALCAELAGVILDHPDDPTPHDYRGVSQCHLPLITDAREVKPNLWKGHIVNPRDGKVYGVELRLDAHDNLALRGFLAVPLLGRTQTWTRYGGSVPEDCRLHADALPPEGERAQ